MLSFPSLHKHAKTGRSGRNSKSWQKLRAQLSLRRSAPPCPQHLQQNQRQRSHHARAPPCQFPVESNVNLRIMLSYSPMRRARAQDPSESVAAVTYRRHWAKRNDQAPQKRAFLAYGPGHSKSSALTCKAKRETYIRFHQYSSLLHKVYNVVWGCALSVLEMLHYNLPFGIRPLGGRYTTQSYRQS